jgi:ribosomal protein S25
MYHRKSQSFGDIAMSETKTTNAHDLARALKTNYRWHADELYKDFKDIVGNYTGQHDEESLQAVLKAALRMGLVTSLEIEEVLGISAARARVWVRDIREEGSHRRLAHQLLAFIEAEMGNGKKPTQSVGEEFLDRPIEELELSTRTRTLLGDRFKSVRDLTSKTPADLLRLTNFGKQAVKEVENALGKHDLGLKKP